MEKHPVLDRIVDFSADGRRVVASMLVLSLILAGCADMRERFSIFSSSDTSHTEGGRRAPTMNPGGGMMPAMQVHTGPHATAMQATSSASANPYDSTPGMRHSSPKGDSYMAAAPAGAQEERGWFSGMFDGWFGKEKMPAQAGRRRPVENQPQLAAAPEAPRMEMAAPVDDVAQSAPKPLLNEEGYPELSAIPPVPERAAQFRKDKSATHGKFADMQAEQKNAEAARATLAGEPAVLDEAALPADEELAIAARKDAENGTPLPAALPPVDKDVNSAPAKTMPAQKEEGGLFSWMKNPFSSEEKKEASAPKSPVAPRELGAAPVMKVEASKDVMPQAPKELPPSRNKMLRSPGALDVTPPPSISEERPIVLREPKSARRYEEVAPGHLRLTPPSMATRNNRTLPQSRYAAKRAQQRVVRGAGATADAAAYY